MTLPLSILDLAAVNGDATPAQAIRDVVELAKTADALGYRRYWLAEHHARESHAGTAPEVLLAALTQATSRIRLGSGGVMLVNYSPLKVAEQFMVLEALAPGRIDLGVGRALGAEPKVGNALRTAGLPAFGQYLSMLSAWLLDAIGKGGFPANHPGHGIRAQPGGPSCPDLFLLCSSVNSATLAGQFGVGMAYAEFLSGSGGAEAVAAYRASFRPSPFRQTPLAAVAVGAFAADTGEEAERLDRPRRAWTVAYAQGANLPFPDMAEADRILTKFPDHPMIAEAAARVLIGDGPTVRAGLAAKMTETSADELFVLAAGPNLAARQRCLELMIG